MHLLVLNGPNLNMLGVREPDIYGKTTYTDLCKMIEAHAREKGVQVTCEQSNHEGTLVDLIQGALGRYDGIVLNPGAYTHTSIALLDALKAVGLPAVEVHISDVGAREPFRQISYVAYYAEKRIIGNAPCQGHTECDSIIMDNGRILAVPGLEANNVDAALVHEAAIGKIAGEQLVKLMTLGLTEAEAEEQIINGFLR